MKRKSLVILLGIEAVILTALSILTSFLPTAFSSVTAFPFEQIAGGLSHLSKTGNIGNGFAFALIVGISLIPTVLALKTKRSRETLKERIVLFLLSAVMLVAFYGMANPGLFCKAPVGDFGSVVKSALGITVWSVIVLYIILRLTRMFISGDTKKLIKYLKVMLYVLCAFFTAVIFATCVSDLVASLKSAGEVLESVLCISRFLVLSVPNVFDIVITVSAISLLDVVLSKEKVGIAQSAAKLSRVCCISLCITTASTAFFNVIQIALMRYLANIAVNVDVPIISIAFTLIVLLACRLLVENKRLRDDNDLFI